MEKSWFEMRDKIRRRLSDAVWIPLKAWTEERTGERGFVGYQAELFGANSVAIFADQRVEGELVSWSDAQDAGVWVQDGHYKSADSYERRLGEPLGIHLVLVQQFDGAEPSEWHLNQDLVFALRLRREGDVWVCPSEGYEEAVRLVHTDNGKKSSLLIRADYLRDYLAARNLALRVSTYQSRSAVLEDSAHIAWARDPEIEALQGGRFEGRSWDIHEGGFPFGAQTGVFHMSRVDVDTEAEVPQMGPENAESTESRQWTVDHEGRKLSHVEGEFWRDEWIEPAPISPRVRGDHVPSSTTFIINGSGERLSGDELNSEAIGLWLWFSPEVALSILSRRGGLLEWYTRETGALQLSAGGNVHFGFNELGLLNVYGHDIGRLAEWERRLWAGFNVVPDGGVSAELTASQVRAEPATTSAPESFISTALEDLNSAFQDRFNGRLIQDHESRNGIFIATHRFRARDQASFLSLAKDIARLTADSFDVALLRRILGPDGSKFGSLRGLQGVLARFIGEQGARNLVGPLVGIYKLRLGDAHLPSAEITEALALARIDPTLPWVCKGRDLLHIAVSVIYTSAQIIRNGGPLR